MKSMYAMKMSLLVSLASSRATIIILEFFVWFVAAKGLLL